MAFDLASVSIGLPLALLDVNQFRPNSGERGGVRNREQPRDFVYERRGARRNRRSISTTDKLTDSFCAGRRELNPPAFLTPINEREILTGCGSKSLSLFSHGLFPICANTSSHW